MFSHFFSGKDDPHLKEDGPYSPFTAAHIAIIIITLVLVIVLFGASV